MGLRWTRATSDMLRGFFGLEARMISIPNWIYRCELDLRGEV